MAVNETPLFRSRGGLIAMIVAGALLVVGLLQSATQPTPTDGPAGSSFATHGAGTAALVDLLEANGYDVIRERRLLGEFPPPPGDTIVIINGRSLSVEDETAIADHVQRGGRLVAMGSTRLNFIVDRAPTQLGTTTEPSRGQMPVGAFGEIRRAAASRIWTEPGSLLPVVGNGDGTLVGIQSIDEGTVVAVADETIAANDGLAKGDNALLALLAVGDSTATIRFVEYIHGFTQPTGLAALPARWQQALLVLTLAGMVWLVARGRRFGPPEATSRSLAPPRSAYIDALALTLESSRDTSAARILDEAISAELRRRGAEGDSPASLIDTAVRAGADRQVAVRALGAGTDRETTRAKATLLSLIVNKEQL